MHNEVLVAMVATVVIVLLETEEVVGMAETVEIELMLLLSLLELWQILVQSITYEELAEMEAHDEQVEPLLQTELAEQDDVMVWQLLLVYL